MASTGSGEHELEQTLQAVRTRQAGLQEDGMSWGGLAGFLGVSFPLRGFTVLPDMY